MWLREFAGRYCAGGCSYGHRGTLLWLVAAGCSRLAYPPGLLTALALGHHCDEIVGGMCPHADRKAAQQQ